MVRRRGAARNSLYFGALSLFVAGATRRNLHTEAKVTYNGMMQRRMLSVEDEVATNGEEVEVRKEDQDRINRFSRLHQRETLLEEKLKTKQKDKEDLEEISTELELVDEEEKVPYKLGDSFLLLPLPEVQSLLEDSTTRIDEDVSALEERLSSVREEMEALKVELYGRFGRSINLET